jgi:hypothetical protein
MIRSYYEAHRDRKLQEVAYYLRNLTENNEKITKNLSQPSHKYLPNLEYDAGGTKQLSSTIHEILSSSAILVTPGICSSKPNMLPKVILAFNT